MLPAEEHLRLLQQRAAGIPTRQEALNRSRALRGTIPGIDRTVWREMCANGWLGLCVPEQAGGLGRGVRALCQVAEQLGTSMAPEPLVPATMAAVLLPAAHLPAVLSGERIVLPAWQEERGSLAVGGTTVLRDGRVSGRKLNVPMAAAADAFLVTLGDGLALVARDALGLGMEIAATPDGCHTATLTFADTPAETWDGNAGNALDQAIMATAAYLVGVVDGALAALSAAPGRDSSETAMQFDAGLRTQLTLTQAVVKAAAAAMDGEQGGAVRRRRPARDSEQAKPLQQAAAESEQGRAMRRAAVSRAMLRAADAAVVVTQGCVRLARGLPDSDTELYRRKAMTLAGAYGTAMVHRARAAAGIVAG